MTDAVCTSRVIDRLRAEGYQVTSSYVEFLRRERHIPEPDRVGNALCWSQSDVDALEAELRRRGRYRPVAVAP